ncbi:hypothetical protein [Bradyrhizobium sp. CCGB01]|nr:hypothetical protein [Bradyrhizobium sp. CCGB01]MCP3410392.1 hypothetical protein [Bradyrhizobium sp. CCGB01]
MKHLQLMAGRIYNLLKKEAAYGPNTQHLEDFRAAQKLDRSFGDRPDDASTKSLCAGDYAKHGTVGSLSGLRRSHRAKASCGNAMTLAEITRYFRHKRR